MLAFPTASPFSKKKPRGLSSSDDRHLRGTIVNVFGDSTTYGKYSTLSAWLHSQELRSEANFLVFGLHSEQLQQLILMPQY
jgi:hypothetical protein